MSWAFKVWFISAMLLLKCYFWSIWIFITVKMIIWNWNNVVYQQMYLELLLDVMDLEIIWIWTDGNDECVTRKTQIHITDMECHPKSVFGPLWLGMNCIYNGKAEQLAALDCLIDWVIVHIYIPINFIICIKSWHTW